jgi:hypothetical protein
MFGLGRSGRLSASKPANPLGTAQNPQTSAPARTRTVRKPPARTRGFSTSSADGDDDYGNPSEPKDPDNPKDPNHPENPGRRRNNNRKPGRSNLAAALPAKRVVLTELLSQKGQKELPAVQLSAMNIPVTPQFVNTNRVSDAIENGLRMNPTSPHVYKPSTCELSFVWGAESRKDRDFVPVEDKLELHHTQNQRASRGLASRGP